ncbi:hypothetical protein [Cellulomonas aerilata]|uniref:O-antigen/teichoic acid export membrane protein n=1 Tax=Cellulomonas aerilata TaxID=515326 RepID=A0A512DCC4_9CELL|nr:hypothetical protein [Cellulomonas aerilata]GEO34124.1 hypothetical protein CAE01nite_18490 [Cellulomonas aerilata]
MVVDDRPHRLAGAPWGVLDQAISTGTNFLLTIVVVRSASLEDFGAFSLVYVIYIFALGLLRTSGGNVLTVAFAGDEERLAVASRSFLGYALGCGGAIGGAAAVGSLAVGGTVRHALLALAVAMPLLMVQDALRSIQFARGHPARAAETDAVWALVLVALLVPLVLAGESRPWVFLAAWGAGGAVAAGAALARARLRPARPSVLRWLRAQSRLVVPMVGAYALSQFPPQLVYLCMPFVSDLHELGAVRAAYVLFGPMAVVFSGLSATALPAAVRAAGGPGVLLLTRRLSLVLALVAVGWGAAVVLAPDPLGVLVLGPSWEGTAAVRAFLAVSGLGEAVLVGAWVALSALQMPGRLVRVRLVTAPVQLVAGLVLSWRFGAVGTAAAFALANVLTAALAWRRVPRSSG